MKIINKLFSMIFIIYINIISVPIYTFAIGNVDWILLKENEDGKEWLDKGSIKILKNNEISVLTKFYKNPKDSRENGETSLYVMRINCKNKTFKDTSINGILQFNAKWQASNDDELLDEVIEKSCLEIT